jgi:hypothetical protein
MHCAHSTIQCTPIIFSTPQFALQEKVKFGREINAREREIFQNVADNVLRTIQFKEVEELSQETWFEGRYLSTGPATAVYLNDESGVMLIQVQYNINSSYTHHTLHLLIS